MKERADLQIQSGALKNVLDLVEFPLRRLPEVHPTRLGDYEQPRWRLIAGLAVGKSSEILGFSLLWFTA